MANDRRSEDSDIRRADAMARRRASPGLPRPLRFGGDRVLSLAAAGDLQRIGRRYAFGVPDLSHPLGSDGPDGDASFGPR